MLVTQHMQNENQGSVMLEQVSKSLQVQAEINKTEQLGRSRSSVLSAVHAKLFSDPGYPHFNTFV